jgi:hypothetical protein
MHKHLAELPLILYCPDEPEREEVLAVRISPMHGTHGKHKLAIFIGTGRFRAI